jgi:hypothetical protein
MMRPWYTYNPLILTAVLVAGGAILVIWVRREVKGMEMLWKSP